MSGTVVVKYVVPFFGCLLANFMFITPMAAVMRVRREERLGDINPLPFVAIGGNCIGWIVYAYVKRDFFIFFGNQPGFIESIFYSLSCLPYATKSNRNAMLLFACAAAFVHTSVGLVDALAVDSNSGSALLWGSTSTVFLLIYYSSPLATVYQVIRLRSSASLYWPLSVASTCNALLWFIYGVYLRDGFIWAPNAVGVAMGILQLILIYKFPVTPGGGGGGGGTSPAPRRGGGGGGALDRPSGDTDAEEQQGSIAAGGSEGSAVVTLRKGSLS